LEKNMNTNATAKFELGQIVITRAAMEVLPNEDVLRALSRHVWGDWGDVDDHERPHIFLNALRLFAFSRFAKHSTSGGSASR
jgi:hypothetical protein